MLLHPRSSSSNESPLGKVVRLTKGCERESSVSVTIFGTTQYLAGKSIFATVHQQTVLPYGNILAKLVAKFVAFGRHSLLWPMATTFNAH